MRSGQQTQTQLENFSSVRTWKEREKELCVDNDRVSKEEMFFLTGQKKKC
jgi:hypothetical protein